MGIADDVKTLGEEIVASYDMRVKALGELAVDTHKTLKGFVADRKEMSKEQAKALADFVADLTKNVGAMIGGFADEREKMARNWQNLVADMAKKRSGKPKVEAVHKVRSVEEAIEEEVKPERKKKGKKGRR